MNYYLSALFSLSVGIGAVIGWIRLRKIVSAYLPFLWLLWLGLINELLSIGLMQAKHSNVINFNLFSLIQALLITYQMFRWGLFQDRKPFYFTIQATLLLSWMYELFILQSIYQFNSYFTIFHSFVIVLMSISTINQITFKEPGSLAKNPIFLICMGFIFYFTYAVLVEAFWIYGLNHSRAFRIRIYEIMAYVNLFTNFIYAFAILWIPLKRRYILQY